MPVETQARGTPEPSQIWVLKEGDKGGYITFEGTPDDLKKVEDNYTAKYLRESFMA